MVAASKYCVRMGARLPDYTDNSANHDKSVTLNGKTYTYDFGYNDETNNDDRRKIAGMTPNPWWHGYRASNNYIMSAIYAARMAKAIGDGSAQKPKNTNGFKKAVVWGMAIHTATDIFSHNAKTRLCDLTHDAGLADRRSCVPKRYEDATEVARRMMAKYEVNQIPTAQDLYISPTDGYGLYSYLTYLDDVDSSITCYEYKYDNCIGMTEIRDLQTGEYHTYTNVK